MLELPTVTLCCIDTANHRLALRALARSRAGIRFARTLFLTDRLPPDCAAPDGVDIVPLAPLGSRDDYSQFVLKELHAHIETGHVLLVQWDGYVVNPAAWDPAFLACDYLGARWYWYDDGMRVGNGGFSLRSRKLLAALQDPRIRHVENEDTTICRTFRPLLEREHAIRFGDDALADRFSFEAAYPIDRPFGFHGLFNFCRTVEPPELAELASGFSDAIARSPQLLQLLRNCNALGQWVASVAIGRRVLVTTPSHAEVATLLAIAERGLARGPAVGRNEPCHCGSGRKFKHCHGELDVAKPHTRGAATPDAPAMAKPGAPGVEALVAAGVQAHRRNELTEAERLYRQALASAPAHPRATHYLGMVCYQTDRLDDALALIEASLPALPALADYASNHGLVLAALDRDDEAIAAFRRALVLNPDYAIGWNNLGLTLQAQNRLDEAADAFRRALALSPSFAEARWNLGLALLAAGRFREGWPEYEARLGIAALAKHAAPPDRPRWDGVVRPGSTLLLTAEQGLGDALQFARFATPIAARGVRVLLQAPAALARLLASVPGVAGAFALDAPLPSFDAHAPLLSLPGHLGVSALEHIPAQVPYLDVDAQRYAKATETVRARPARLRVGLAWAGSREHRNDRRRSMRLAQLAPLFGIDGIAWFSLQKGDAEREIAALSDSRAPVPLPAGSDFDDTAAKVAALDLVISVDTSVAHLAGALALPVWILLPFAPDWRWLLARNDSPWYPTATLFRQPRPGDWDAVVREVAAALVARLSMSPRDAALAGSRR
jgi:tetratricopeptide (TPR) repeat protein